MTVARFFRHGDYVKPHYVPVSGDPLSGPGSSTDADRPGAMVPGLVERYGKAAPAGAGAISFGLITHVYQQAIEYTSRAPALRGLSLLAGVLGAVFGIWVGIHRWFVEINSVSHNMFDSLALAFPPLFIAFGVIILLWTARLELFCPVDEPIIFDRKHRKVFRIFRNNKPGLKGLFQPWPLYAAEYEWDLIDAEYHAASATTGATITRYHNLVLLVRRSAQDPTVIDSFNVGSSAELGEQTVPAIWEHIRRYMEENGPALQPGETVLAAERPGSLGQSISVVGPFGANYARWWKEQLPFMLLIHILFPFFVPFFLLWGLLNWLSYKTALPATWPKEVLTMIEP